MRSIIYSWVWLSFSLISAAVGAAVLNQGGFVVHFQPDDQVTAHETLAWLEEARDEFAPRLPLGAAPVEVTIAGDMDEFKGLAGPYSHVGVSGVTRASGGLIALKSPRLRPLGDDYRGTVRHELVHVLLHRNTDTGHVPRWLNEGICMLLANELRWGSSTQVAEMRISGQLMAPADLEGAFSLPESNHQFGNAYAQALSMTRYLRDEIGEEAFWGLVTRMNQDDFETALNGETNLTASAFWEDYKGSLWGLTLLSILQTGSFWGATGLLCVLAFAVRQWRNRSVVRRWAAEDAEGDDDEPFDWEAVLPDPDEWKSQ